ncbi:MAG: 16S rRNA (cytosine(1402)-N(4))-methyltransferase RsmH [Candidatus Kerfeldbacteria bacterium]|nr:16S rRNA (cytosine(1402)-N(4))-methyltransferase RsmH [Candidatus Kerfeldbacteria bacterium]
MMNNRTSVHVPVLLQEVLHGLNLAPNDTVIDGTVGGGGHTRSMLGRIAPHGVVIGFDRDAQTLHETTQWLQEFGARFIPIHDSYANAAQYRDVIDAHQPIRGILLDLGLSSLQLDEGKRGFSFRQNGLLDMRFDQTQGETAAELLNTASEEELLRILREYGEEPHARKIAREIVQRRAVQPFEQSAEFAEFIEQIIHRRPGQKIHPATRTFQALRIAVNHELEHLQQFLSSVLNILAPGGRLAIISFHSLEDRIVKHQFRLWATECICPPEIPECRCDHHAVVKQITKKPIQPSAEEVAENPRARSAKLRMIEKL